MEKLSDFLENRLTPPVEVVTCGLIDRRRFHSTPGTKENDVMLTVFLSGYGRYRSSVETATVERGYVGLVLPDDPGILMANPEDPYVHLYCRFRGSFGLAMAARIVGERGRRFFRCDAFLDVARSLRAIVDMGARSAFRTGRFDRRDLALLEALVALDQPGGGSSGLRGADIHRYLVEHVDEPTDLCTIAQAFGVSRSTICRRAREELGESVQRHHEGVKLEWAKTLLRDTDLQVAEVAARVGFADPFYFSRVFKRRTGRSPRAFRRLP